MVQTDQRRWDYKHQVLMTRHFRPWQLFICVKLIEAAVQLRPRALWRLAAQRDQKIGHAVRWYYRMGRRVWFHEIFQFFCQDRRVQDGPTLAAFWGKARHDREEAHVVSRARAAHHPAQAA